MDFVWRSWTWVKMAAGGQTAKTEVVAVEFGTVKEQHGADDDSLLERSF